MPVFEKHVLPFLAMLAGGLAGVYLNLNINAGMPLVVYLYSLLGGGLALLSMDVSPQPFYGVMALGGCILAMFCINNFYSWYGLAGIPKMRNDLHWSAAQQRRWQAYLLLVLALSIIVAVSLAVLAITIFMLGGWEYGLGNTPSSMVAMLASILAFSAMPTIFYFAFIRHIRQRLPLPR